MSKRLFRTALGDADGKDLDGIGSIRYEKGNVYKYIKYNDGTGDVAGADGDVVVYHGDDGWDDSEVTVDLTDGVVVAGCLQAALTDGQFGWMLVNGQDVLSTAIEASLDSTPVAAGDGDPVCRGAADKTLRRVNTVIDANTERTPQVGVAIDASAKKVIFLLGH